jgi:hypothetical protein
MKHPFAKLVIKGIMVNNILGCSMCQIAKKIKKLALTSSNFPCFGILLIQ